MSTYTDLHNRVQESINVDYNSRITPQKVKLLNEENEYWGTFKGTMQVDSIDVTGGTLSNVTIKDAVLDGVQLKNAAGLTAAIDLQEYAKSADMELLCAKVDNVSANVGIAVDKATAAATSAEQAAGQINGVIAEVDQKVERAEQYVDNSLANLDGSVDNKISAAEVRIAASVNNQLTGINANVAILSGNLNVLKSEVSAKDTVEARLHGDEIVHNDLISARDDLSHALYDVSVALVTNDSSICTSISNIVDAKFSAATDARSTICTDLSNAITAETASREARDNALDTKIDDISAELYRKINDDVAAETTARIAEDSRIYGELTDEVATRTARDEELLAALTLSVDTINRHINTEQTTRISEDDALKTLIDEEAATRKVADNQMLDTVTNVSDSLSINIDMTKEQLLSVLEHDRHYVLNTDVSGYKTTDIYPLSAKDMAVNVYDMTLADGKVIFVDPTDSTSVEIGEVILQSEDPFEIRVHTFANISNDKAAAAIKENDTYIFNDENLSRPTGKNYNFQYVKPVAADEAWSDGMFKLVPDVVNFHFIRYEGVGIGKAYDVKKDDVDTSSIISGKYKLYSTDVALSVFNKFDAIAFNTGELSSKLLDTERVTYVGNNQFELKRGIDNTKYISLVDENDDHIEFGRIYEKIGSEAGVDIDENQIKKIRVETTAPSNKTVYLRAEAGFSALVSSDIEKNGRRYNSYLCAEVDGLSAEFTLFEASQLYRYRFVHDDLIDDDAEITASYVTPLLYNKTLDQSNAFLCAVVDLTHVPVLSSFRKQFTLIKEESRNEWTAAETNAAGEHINISYNIANLYINYGTAENKTVVYHEYPMSIVPDEEAGFIDRDVIVKYKTDGAVGLESFPIATEVPDATYIVSIDSESQSYDMVTYELPIDTADNKLIKIVVPDKKTDYSLQSQISREFMTVFRIRNKTGADEMVQIKFIDTDGNDLPFYNNKHLDLWLKTNSWTTLQVNEIRPNRFLITDLNQNEDRFLFEMIRKALLSDEANISTLSNDTIPNLSSQLTSLSSQHVSEASFLSGAIEQLCADAFILSDDNVVSTKTTFTNQIDVESAGISGLSADVVSASSITAEIAMLSDATVSELSAASMTAVSAKLSGIAFNALSDVVDASTTSSLQDTVDDLTTQISTTSADLDERLGTVSGVVDGALSGDIELPVHHHANPDSSVTNITATVSKLIIVDEVTYDKYALTIRNGTLNIDKIGHYEG